jgi:hypothetical protein
MKNILQLWNLRNHPFSPREFLLKPLDPKVEGLINFYFDFYGWPANKLIHGVSQQSFLDRFPRDVDLKEPKSLLIIIHGFDGSGRESLRNLLLHKIRFDSGKEPILVDLTLNSLNHTENVKMVARNFWDAYEDAGQANPRVARLKEIYEDETRAPPTGSQSFYQNLFTRMNSRVRKSCPNPIVLVVDCEERSPGNTYDSWRVLYNSTSPLFQYVIIVTSDMDNAKDCNTIFLRDEKNVALIVSRQLELKDARQYLVARLAGERENAPKGLAPLEPFTEEALSELFLPGQAKQERIAEQRKAEAGKPQEERGRQKVDPQSFRIFELNRLFIYAFDYHLSRLQKEDFANLQPHDVLIGAKTITEVCEMINKGEKCPVPMDL